MDYQVIVTTQVGLSQFEEVKPAETYRQALTLFAEEMQKDDIVSVILVINQTLIADFDPTRIIKCTT